MVAADRRQRPPPGHHTKRQAGRVLLSPAAFDELAEREQFLAAIQQGMADEQAGRSHTTEEVFDAVEKRIAAIEAE